MARPMTDQELNRLIGAKLQLRRVQQGLTRGDLASACVVTPEEVRAFETGQADLFSDDLLLLARALDVDVDYFFDRDD